MNRALVLAVPVAAACADDGGPRIETVTPAAAGYGTVVVLTGERMCLGQPCNELGGEVQLGLAIPSYRAPVLAASDTRWEFTVPAIVPPGETDVLITVGGRSSNALPFEVRGSVFTSTTCGVAPCASPLEVLR